MTNTVWPKVLPPLSQEQTRISNDFMKHWHEVLASKSRYGAIEKFNHAYAVKNSPKSFTTTLEIGAGLGEHLKYEDLSDSQLAGYTALELRENMASEINKRFPRINTLVGNCQTRLPFEDGYFDRILAIHVLEHLPDLPSAIKEMYRLCKKDCGVFSVVIPCEGGLLYSMARKISAQRIFEKKYKQPYKWFIEREHLNKPAEIFHELERYFTVKHRSFFPFYLANVNLNLCIGLTLSPKGKNLVSE